MRASDTKVRRNGALLPALDIIWDNGPSPGSNSWFVGGRFVSGRRLGVWKIRRVQGCFMDDDCWAGRLTPQRRCWNERWERA
ncbi:MAG: hypothetical protein IH991_21150 [Planctomycetes bacterium]|nr:hypothetical protein [Planctomycetota bacterium]